VKLLEAAVVIAEFVRWPAPMRLQTGSDPVADELEAALALRQPWAALERTCAELSKLRITRGPRSSAIEQPIAAGSTGSDPPLARGPIRRPCAARCVGSRSCWRPQPGAAAAAAAGSARRSRYGGQLGARCSVAHPRRRLGAAGARTVRRERRDDLDVERALVANLGSTRTPS
jgi:hypothetical protein